MHELGVVFHVVDMVEDLCNKNALTEVKSVTIELGEVSTVIESYLYDVWKWAVKKKSVHMKEAELIVETIPAVSYCQDCKKEYGTVEYGKICPYCKSENTFLLQGNEFNIKEIEAR